MQASSPAARFVVLEGLDGAGTTTQTRLLGEWLRGLGLGVHETYEPSPGPIGLLIRQALRGRLVARPGRGEARPPGNDVMALLFAADRMDHLESEVLPALESGRWVLSDRYYHSSLLYQSLDGDQAWVRALNSHARAPDVTYVLDVPAAAAALRRSGRGATPELYETDPIQLRLEGLYRELPRLLPGEPIAVLDGSRPPAEVLRSLQADLQRRFGLAHPGAHAPA
jgi:dTMP kinase